MLYLELTLGQFTRVGPAVAYGRIRPIIQGSSATTFANACHAPSTLGIGWAMVCMSLLVSIYYNMVVAWTLIYLFKIVTGSSSQWASCTNDYNTACRFAPKEPRVTEVIPDLDCSSSMEDERCTEEMSGQFNESTLAFYFNGACHSINDTAVAAVQTALFAEKSPTSPAEEFFE